MRFDRQVMAGALAAALSAAAFAQGALVKVDGSSTVYPVTEAVAEEFQKAEKNAIKVTVGISGTGGGFKKFCRGETDVCERLAPDPQGRDGRVRKGGNHLLRAADRVRRAHRRRQSEEHVPRQGHHRRAAEEDVGAGGAGQDHQVEPGRSFVARTPTSSCSAPAPTPAPSTTSPKRSSARRRRAAATTRHRKTTTCWCRASSAT